ERIQQPVHVEQIPWADRAHASDVLELQLAQQQPAHVAPHPMLHFQSYDVAVGAPLRFLLNHVQQVLGASLVELEIAAARDTKGVGSLDLAPPIDEIQIGAHHVLERYQAPAVRQGNEARQALRQLEVREVHRARRGVSHQDRQRQSQVGHHRKRVPRSPRDRLRGRQWKDLLREVAADYRPIGLAQLAPALQADALGGELGQTALEQTLRIALQLRAQTDEDGIELLLRAEPVLARLSAADLQRVLEGADLDHE